MLGKSSTLGLGDLALNNLASDSGSRYKDTVYRIESFTSLHIGAPTLAPETVYEVSGASFVEVEAKSINQSLSEISGSTTTLLRVPNVLLTKYTEQGGTTLLFESVDGNIFRINSSTSIKPSLQITNQLQYDISGFSLINTLSQTSLGTSYSINGHSESVFRTIRELGTVFTIEDKTHIHFYTSPLLRFNTAGRTRTSFRNLSYNIAGFEISNNTSLVLHSRTTLDAHFYEETSSELLFKNSTKYNTGFDSKGLNVFSPNSETPLLTDFTVYGKNSSQVETNITFYSDYSLKSSSHLETTSTTLLNTAFKYQGRTFSGFLTADIGRVVYNIYGNSSVIFDRGIQIMPQIIPSHRRFDRPYENRKTIRHEETTNEMRELIS